MNRIKILLADEGQLFAHRLVALLNSMGYAVLTAEDRASALLALREESPALLILGVTLVEDGEAMVGFIRRTALLAQISIIVLGAGIDEAARTRLLDAGADDCVASSIGQPELTARIRTLLRRHERTSVASTNLDLRNYLQMLKLKYPILLLTLILSASLTGCTQSDLATLFAALDGSVGTADVDAVTGTTTGEDRPAGWGEDSHSNDADLNYEVVFPEGKVNQITFKIDPETWEAMQANMTELFGEAGSMPQGPGNRGGFGPPQDGQPPADRQPPGNFQPPAGFQPPPGDRAGGPGFPGGDMTPENPMWVTATVEFEGQIWTNVGIRYKGNSSLRSTWGSGSRKLPFKLDFDEFEDEYPQIKNQRFYGFDQLSFANNFSDASSLRETVTYDLLEESGLPAAETAFYEILLDYGEGPVSLGLYTLVEVIDDTVVARIFGGDDGNIYEAEGTAASFAAGTFDQIAESFQKENNKGAEDWSDIEALFNLLHSDLRTSDPERWRADLEAIFDVDGFLHWLAISAVIQHWDTYGAMTHNYYLYNDPETGRLTWISWDHNMSMMAGMFGGRGGPDRQVSLDKAEIGENWPLIRYLLDQPTYSDLYVRYVEETADGIFTPEKMAKTYTRLAEVIDPYATAEIGEAAFDAAVQQLIDHAYARAEAVQLFLDAQP